MPVARTRTRPRPDDDVVDHQVEGVVPRTVVAAAARIKAGTDVRRISQSVDGWATAAWGFYDTIGEFRYGVDWIAQMIAKARLFITVDGAPAPDDDPVLAAALGEGGLFGADDERSDMLRLLGIHLTVAGEAYLLGTVQGGVDHWQIAAACELKTRGGRYYVAGKLVESDVDPFVLRLWRPHPRKPHEANSPSRAVLTILAEIDALTKRIFAEIDSRLAGPGILWVPAEFSLPVQLLTTADGRQIQGGLADQFQALLTGAMVEAIGDQTSAQARTPIVVTVPGEKIAQITRTTFDTPMDERVKELRDEAIRRLGLGMDLPPEILTGMGDTNHWTAWQVSSEAIKVHAEPLLALVTDSLTTGFLWDLLRATELAEADVRRYAVAADTAEMRLRPDRSREAFELYDRGQISGAALRREVGFDEHNDAPDERETRDYFLRKVASGQTTPELVALALQMLGVMPAGTEVAAAPAVEARPVPSLEQHPAEGPPPVPEELVAAADVIVHRALERAGNKLRSKTGSRLTCKAADLYLHVPVSPTMADHVLTDAFGALDRYAGCRQIDSTVLSGALDAYCRALLTTASPHDADRLRPYLHRAMEMTA